MTEMGGGGGSVLRFGAHLGFRGLRFRASAMHPFNIRGFKVESGALGF